MRVRIWYCLYCLETTLCLITGRPCAIQDRICSAPYPSALNDEILPAQYSDVAVLDAYFSKHQTLMAISADMLFILYSEKSFRDKSWSQVQDLIVRLSTSLQNWRIQLPLALDFFKEETDTVFRRQRLNLAFQYYTILMLTNRPCLSKTSARKDSTPNESLEFREFSKTSQDLIPNSPWWCLIHHLIPANKIIMLEMADENLHTPEYRAALLEDCKMVLVWLRSMSKVNAALRRHSLELSDQLKQVVPGIDAQLEEEIVESGTQDVTTQSISSSAEYTASTLPQATGFGDMRFDIYGKTCYTTEYQYFNSASALLCSSSYQPDRDSIMIESPSSGHSRPRNSPRVDNMSLWLDT
ncbi:uncharacterized protein H6S33_010432 [Morchella sextelata]|uniref:uncharacterized protein n=1 Tax=Morchella sextelata TaxID=1174677 RepID=UPI001D050ACC|nr:uncharacterized protein H6S33_010432 [Morchella sextelata]KAH0612380.1 hypothetical protein H6S33_010432 [Morchella sextelata]